MSLCGCLPDILVGGMYDIAQAVEALTKENRVLYINTLHGFIYVVSHDDGISC